jgi:hypothetical protein
MGFAENVLRKLLGKRAAKLREITPAGSDSLETPVRFRV